MFNFRSRGVVSISTIIGLVVVAAVVAGGVWVLTTKDSKDEPVMTTDASDSSNGDTVQEMVGNPDLDVSKMPEKYARALQDINKIVSSTDDCSAANFKVTIPDGWQCRKLDSNARDVTLYTDNNTLNVTIGFNQGMSSCSVLPICTEEPSKLSDKFIDTKKFKQPIGTVEFVGTYKSDNKIKLLVTSNDAPSAAEMDQIKSILDSMTQ
jgi:hypothetical protein